MKLDVLQQETLKSYNVVLIEDLDVKMDSASGMRTAYKFREFTPLTSNDKFH